MNILAQDKIIFDVWIFINLIFEYLTFNFIYLNY